MGWADWLIGCFSTFLLESSASHVLGWYQELARAFCFEFDVHIRARDDSNTETFKAMKGLLHHENV